MTLLLGLGIIVATVVAIVRRMDVRLALVLAALALGALGGNIPAIVRAFVSTLSREQFVVPICCAMGFAHVLRLTQCDQHLVHLLVKPLQRVRPFLIPGAVLVGFFVNIPIISQTSTVVALGPVLVPLLQGARISPITTGAALLLGGSVGGELLNPGAPELRTISTALQIKASECVAYVLPLLLTQIGVATLVFWFTSLRYEARLLAEKRSQPEEEPPPELAPFRVNVVKAMVPLIPLAILFLTGGPTYLLTVPREWLIDPANLAEERLFDGRLIGAAMLVGVVVAAATDRKALPSTAKAFFEGTGYAFMHIISLIVAASCFGAGVEQIGLAKLIGELAGRVPALLIPSAGVLPLSFAWVCGSGMATTQSLFRFFTEPSINLDINPIRVGAVVAIAAAAGRTMSPVAAVTLMCASLTDTSPVDLVRRLVVPLFVSVSVVILLAMLLSQWS